MSTDETGKLRGMGGAETRLKVGQVFAPYTAHPKAQSERDEDALDAWRATRDQISAYRQHAAETLDSAPAEVRNLIELAGNEIDRLQEALHVADARLARAEEAVHRDPETGLFRRDVLFSEIPHLELLDQREGQESEVALISVEAVRVLRKAKGRAVAEIIMDHLGRALCDVLRPGEPGARLGDGDFFVLLTGLSGASAQERAGALAQALANAIDQQPVLRDLRPADVSVGIATLHARESAMEAIADADRDRRLG